MFLNVVNVYFGDIFGAIFEIGVLYFYVVI